MSGTVLVLLPRGGRPDEAAVAATCRVVEWRSAEDVVRELGGVDAAATGTVILVSDGLGADDLAAVVAAARSCQAPVVEVRGQQWDGFSRLELAAVCRGVVSGFGMDGAWDVVEAVRG